jgi:hypothetical protein
MSVQSSLPKPKPLGVSHEMGGPKGIDMKPKREFYILLRHCYFCSQSLRNFITIWPDGPNTSAHLPMGYKNEMPQV